MPIGERGWFYHDVLYNPATDMLKDPMRGFPAWTSREAWLLTWQLYKDGVLVFGKAFP
jgi:hypothetical protein